ncbi:MAG: hypothetical protein AB1611_15805 [bacterium]
MGIQADKEKAVFRKEAILAKVSVALGWLITIILLLLPASGRLPEVIGKYSIISLLGIGLIWLSCCYLPAHLKRLTRASWVLTHTQPEKMFTILSPPMIKGRQIMAELWAHEADRDHQPVERLEILSSRLRFFLKDADWVMVFHDPEPDGIVVIQAGQDILWGLRKNT